MTMVKKVVGVVVAAVVGFVLAAGVNIYLHWDKKPAPEVAAVQVEAATPGDACACAAGAWCEGPRGGSYCLDAGGKKRYRAR